MHDIDKSLDIDHWLNSLRVSFSETAPDLLNLFEIYAAEAKFGREFIGSDLAELKFGSKILEVGAGSLLLSCQLVREGYQVVALEPIGDGFSHFEKMRQHVLKYSKSKECAPEVLDLNAEALNVKDYFNFAFSINVMEHVNNVEAVLENVVNSLSIGAKYHFTCPNYIFPYEPHFNIPTFFSKNLTKILLYKKIYNNKKLPDPIGTWNSLNWINVIQIKRSVNRSAKQKVVFNNLILVLTFERVISDLIFAQRRSLFVRWVIVFLVHTRIHLIFRLVPSFLQPVIDCHVHKISE